MYLNYIDYDYLDTYGMSMAEGRGFSEKFPADAVNGCIINKKASGIFGWKSAVGKTIISDGYRYSVIGVIKDYHFQSLTSSIAPMMMVMLREQVPQQIFVSAKIVEDKAFGTINFLSNTTREFFPEDLSGFEYLNEQYRGYYDDLTRIAGITGYFSVLAILIASLGLFALVSYMTNQSLKEIGIRKVLGASFTDIIRLLTRNFVNILLVANLIAWPVGYIICHNLLQNYPYRVDIGFWVFGLSGLSALIMVMAAVSYQAIMAALANPVEAIKYE
jgi:putative ABC transport system permease protein